MFNTVQSHFPEKFSCSSYCAAEPGLKLMEGCTFHAHFMKAVVHGIRQNHPTDLSVTSYQIPSSSYQIKSECFVCAIVLHGTGI
jgi:hypothetical protein